MAEEAQVVLVHPVHQDHPALPVRLDHPAHPVHHLGQVDHLLEELHYQVIMDPRQRRDLTVMVTTLRQPDKIHMLLSTIPLPHTDQFMFQ